MPWQQTHTWPFLTRESAESHVRVNRTADDIAAFHSPTKPEPRRYRIQHFKDRHSTCVPTDRGCVYVTEFWIVKRAD